MKAVKLVFEQHNKILKVACIQHLAELQEKRAADERKAAEKEARTREIEGRRSLMIADLNHAFTGALQSYKTANLE